MAKVEYNQILPKRTVTMDDNPYLVLSSNISKKDRQKASNSVRMKNLRTGNVVERTFHQSDVLTEADVEKQTVKFLYHNRGQFWFCSPDNPSDRFQLEAETVDGLDDFLVENSLVEALVFEGEVMSVLIPVKVELKVKEAPEAVKGNTSSGATKEVILETGYRVQVPQFISTGDVVSINTETGEYSERVAKA